MMDMDAGWPVGRPAFTVKFYCGDDNPGTFAVMSYRLYPAYRILHMESPSEMRIQRRRATGSADKEPIMSNPKDTIAIATTDASDTPIASQDVKADYGRYATYDNKGVVPSDPRAIVAMATQLLEDWRRVSPARRDGVDAAVLAVPRLDGYERQGGVAVKVHVPLSKRDVRHAGQQDRFDRVLGRGLDDILPSNRGQDYLKIIADKSIQWQLHRGRFHEPVETSIKDALICGNGPLKISYERMLKARMAPTFTPSPPITVGNQTTIGPGKFSSSAA